MCGTHVFVWDAKKNEQKSPWQWLKNYLQQWVKRLNSGRHSREGSRARKCERTECTTANTHSPEIKLGSARAWINCTWKTCCSNDTTKEGKDIHLCGFVGSLGCLIYKAGSGESWSSELVIEWLRVRIRAGEAGNYVVKINTNFFFYTFFCVRQGRRENILSKNKQTLLCVLILL